MNIRVLALGVLQRDDGKLLLEKGEDTSKNEKFYRCLGGGIEFGETGEKALVREFKEEINKSITVDRFLGAVENIFEWQGQPGHQVILLFRCRFADPVTYSQDHIPRIDGEHEHTYWKSIEDIRAENALLHPYQFIEMLEK